MPKVFVMTDRDKETIFKSTSHPELIKLKSSNPDKYQEISKKIVDERLNELLPIYRRWQKNRVSMPMYEIAIGSIEGRLKSLDFSLYNSGVEGRRKLTEDFYKTCMCHSVDTILEASGKMTPDIQHAIKNLICRSASILYRTRQEFFNQIQKELGYSQTQLENLPLISFLPFANETIGVEWILQGDMDTLDDIVEDWFLLLRTDEVMFSSDTFLKSLRKHLGEGTFLKVILHHSMSIPSNNIMGLLRVLRGQDMDGFNLNGYTLKERVPFNRFIFGNGHMRYENYIYKNTAIPYLRSYTQLSSDILIDVLLQNKPKPDKSSKKHQRKIPQQYDILNLKLVNEEDLSKIISEIERINKQYDAQYLERILIATDVPADKFVIEPGSIYYNDFCLKSVKIEHAVSQAVLSKIDKKFTIVKNVSHSKLNIKSKKSLSQSFLFSPADDLSFLLAECERLSDKSYIASDVTFPLEGTFELPWKYVRFRDSLMYLIHPNPSKRATTTPFMFRHPEIARSYSDIIKYIEGRCDKFIVKSIDGVIVELKNFDSFRSMIPQFRQYCQSVSEGIETRLMPENKKDFSVGEFKKSREYQKSSYLNHLASFQIESRKIYRILELFSHAQSDSDWDEYGFLFTVKSVSSCSLVIFENATDVSRSTILFKIQTSLFDRAIEVIRTFFASDTVNKRQKLANGSLRFNSPAIVSYHRLNHTNFYDWKSNLTSILHSII